MKAKGDSRVAAVILAAGRSSRMGEAKQLLRLGGVTVLEQTLARVRGADVDELILVLGSSAESIRRQLAASAVERLEVVINPDYEQGMASSLRTGLSALSSTTNAALIVLGDQPFIQSETLNKIIDEYRSTRAQIVIPTSRGFRGNPVLLDRSVFPEVMALEGDIGCRAIFGSHLDGIVKVEVGDPGILLDIDDKNDYERLRHFDKPTQEKKPLKDETRVLKAHSATGSGDELTIVGWGEVATALAKLGQLLNFSVSIVDPMVAVSDVPSGVTVLNTLDLSLLPETRERYVVVASRGRFDEEAIEQALMMSCRYIGLMSSNKRSLEIRRSFEHKGVSAEKLARVHVPAGIDIGATTPEEIALSIMAEIVSHRRAAARA